MQFDSQKKLSFNTIFLHWIVGITIIFLLSIGIFMVETKSYGLYPWHKSFGILITFFIILRIAWRIKNDWPIPVGDYHRLEQIFSRIVHYLLIIGTIVMPISGLIMSAASGNGVYFFGIELVARNPDLTNLEKVIPLNVSITEFAKNLHHIAGYTIIASIILHTTGALKHHFIDKDGTLRRILDSKIQVNDSQHKKEL